MKLGEHLESGRHVPSGLFDNIFAWGKKVVPAADREVFRIKADYENRIQNIKAKYKHKLDTCEQEIERLHTQLETQSQAATSAKARLVAELKHAKKIEEDRSTQLLQGIRRRNP